MIIIWSQPNCPACVVAKNLLTSKNIKFEERMLGDGWTKEQLFSEFPNVRAVPVIVENGKIIPNAGLSHYVRELKSAKSKETKVV